MKRILTALVLIPFALFSIFWAPQPVFVGIVLLMAVGCYREIRSHRRRAGDQPARFGSATSRVLRTSPTRP